MGLDVKFKPISEDGIGRLEPALDRVEAAMLALQRKMDLLVGLVAAVARLENRLDTVQMAVADIAAEIVETGSASPIAGEPYEVLASAIERWRGADAFTVIELIDWLTRPGPGREEVIVALGRIGVRDPGNARSVGRALARSPRIRREGERNGASLWRLVCS